MSEKSWPSTYSTKVDSRDYSGLQLDTRSPTERGIVVGGDKYTSPAPSYDKEVDWSSHLQSAKGSRSTYQGSRSTYQSNRANRLSREESQKEVYSETQPLSRRINNSLGTRKRKIIFFTVLFLVLTIAIVFGAVFGTMHNKTKFGSGKDPVAVNEALPRSDVMVDSPIAPISYTANSNDPDLSPGDQVHRIYFQTADGNISESVQVKEDTQWFPSHPIFTDALNNTGLATYSYINGSAHQSSIFYVNAQNALTEKRWYAGVSNEHEFWEQSSNLSSRAIFVPGNHTFGDLDSDGTPHNSWDSLRLAAVYANFSTGSDSTPSGQGRIFFHASDSSSNWVQEMIWTPSKDSWANGAKIVGPAPGSHMVAVVDETSDSLRLLYTTADSGVAEMWLNTTDAQAKYTSGIRISGILTNPSAEIAAVPSSQGVLLYYGSKGDANITIEELALPSPDAGPVTWNADSVPSAKVIVPDLSAADDRKDNSVYLPLAATMSTAGQESVTVFWAEGVVDPQSGYSTLKGRTRAIKGNWQDPFSVPLVES